MLGIKDFKDAFARAATTDTSVCPDLVPVDEFGYHKSKVYADERQWIFESKAARDKFVHAVNAGRFRRGKV